MMLTRLVLIEPGEEPLLAWSFAYFFFLLCSYYVLRPVRDAMGITGGVNQLQWLFTGTFLVMLAAVPLFGWASSRFQRTRLLPAVYLFFAANLVLFYGAFLWAPDQRLAARAFFIWTSVFNLFVVSVFWSFMADIFTSAQARRLFGFIAAGGSLGAIAGPAITGLLVGAVGTVNLLLLSAVLLLAALGCVVALGRLAPGRGEGGRAIGGGVWDGLRLVKGSSYLLGICAFIWLFSTLGTFLYFEQAHIVEAALPTRDERTAVFALIDLLVNLLTILTQLLVTGHLLSRFGVPTTLALVPALLAFGFLLLGGVPAVAVLIGVQVLNRTGSYAVTRPARETLFTVVERPVKYKAKSFIDTVVYRGGDAVSGWLFAGLKTLGMGLGAIAVLAVPLALLWGWLGWRLGRKQEALAHAGEADHPTLR